MDGAALPWLVANALAFNTTSLIAIGFALHSALGVIGKDRSRSWLASAAVLGALTLVFAATRLALLNAQLGAGLADALNPATFDLAWGALGPSTIAVLAGAGALGFAAVMGVSWLAGIGALGLAAAFALTGHTQGLTQPLEAPAVLALHVLIAGFWVTAPVSLRPSHAVADDVLMARLARFSTVAIIAIPILVAAGLWLAWRILGGLEPLIATSYGKLILLKLAAAIIALGAGALNKAMIPGMIARDAAHGRGWLGMTLYVESLSFAVAIIAVSMATTLWPPTE